jgi:CysZ protein
MLTDITKGTQTLARGIRLLNRPGVRAYAIMPLLINLLLFGALLWYGYHLFLPLVSWLMSYVPSFLDFLEWFIWLFFVLMSAITVFFLFTPVANIIGAPFNALMSEKIEEILTGNPPASDSSFWQVVVDSIGSQLRKLVYIMLWALGLFLFSLIPVLNLAAPVLWFIFGSWLLSLEYLDYPMGNHDLTFSEQKRRLSERRGLAMGFGGAVMVMTSIPVVNFFAMPVAVAGATLLWVEQLNAPTVSGNA